MLGVPETAAHFALIRAEEYERELAAAAAREKQNILRRLARYCRKCVSVFYAWARLSTLATPLLLGAPLRYEGSALDELWWQYFLWVSCQ